MSQTLSDLLEEYREQIDEDVSEFCSLFYKAGIVGEGVNKNCEFLLYLLSSKLLTNSNSLSSLRDRESVTGLLNIYNRINRNCKINPLIAGLHFENALKDLDDC